MKRRLISFLLTVALLVGVTAATGSTAFAVKTVDNPFYDVAEGMYYHDAVLWALDAGVTTGTSAVEFSPSATCTRGQVMTFLWRALGEPEPQNTNCPFADVRPENYFYKPVLWAIEQGITNGVSATMFGAVEQCTTAQVLTFLWRANGQQTATGGALAETCVGRYYHGAVAWAEATGILKGFEKTFYPNVPSLRSDIVTYLYRNAGSPIIRTGIAVTELTAEQIYARCAPAVFYIEVYDEAGNAFARGSGFFVNSTGMAVTNYHVIEGAASAIAVTSDTEQVYNILGVYACDPEVDWAVIQVDGTGFSYLQIGEPSTIVGGASVYAIGSPLGLQNTISQGLISNPARVETNATYIQTSAAISPGSSGGALINKFGHVIGIISASYSEGQNLNIALPMTYLEQALSGVRYSSMHTVLERARPAAPTNVRVVAQDWDTAYIQWDPVPDADYYHFYYRQKGEDTYWYDADEIYTDDPMHFDYMDEYSVAYWGLQLGVTYQVFVTAVKNGIESEDSAVLTFTHGGTAMEVYDLVPWLPDFGAHFGRPYLSCDVEDDGSVYYEYNAVNRNMVWEYLDMLESLGFIYDKESSDYLSEDFPLAAAYVTPDGSWFVGCGWSAGDYLVIGVIPLT